MASTFRISAEILAYLLDLPEDAKLGEIKQDGELVYAVCIDAPGWPEGPVELHYSKNEDGTVSLTGVTPVE